MKIERESEPAGNPAAGAQLAERTGRIFTVEPWTSGSPARLDVLAQSESVFALSNGHVGLRGNLDEGEPHGLPGTYLNSFYELRPLPVRGGRLRLPRVRADRGQRDQRQADPAAGRRRAVRRPVRRAEPARAGARPARRHAAPGGEWCSPAGRTVRVRTTRLVSFTQRAVAAIRVRGGAGGRPRSGWWCSPSWSPTRNCPHGHGPAGRGGAGAAAAGRGATRRTRRRRLHRIHRTRASGLRVAAGMEARGRRPGAHHDRAGGGRDWAGSPRRACSPGERLRLVKFVSVRLVGAAVAAGAARPGRRRRWPPPKLTGWDGLLAEQRALPGRVLGRCGRRGRGRPGGAAGGPVRAVPRAAGRRPGRGAADRGEGPDRSGLRRARVLGHRDLRPAGAHLHPAPAAADALRWRHSTLPAGPGAGRAAGPARRRVPLADDPRPGVLGVLAGRHRGVPHQRRHRRRGGPLYARATTRRSSARSGWSCWWRRRGCGARSATTTGTASSTSTG